MAYYSFLIKRRNNDPHFSILADLFWVLIKQTFGKDYTKDNLSLIAV